MKRRGPANAIKNGINEHYASASLAERQADAIHWALVRNRIQKLLESKE